MLHSIVVWLPVVALFGAGLFNAIDTRASTPDQDLTLQMDALAKAGCWHVSTGKVSGAKADRPRLTEALRFARAGDCLVIWKLDRLSRSMQPKGI